MCVCVCVFFLINKRQKSHIWWRTQATEPQWCLVAAFHSPFHHPDDFFGLSFWPPSELGQHVFGDKWTTEVMSRWTLMMEISDRTSIISSRCSSLAISVDVTHNTICYLSRPRRWWKKISVRPCKICPRPGVSLKNAREFFRWILILVWPEGRESIRWYTIRGFPSKQGGKVNDNTITPLLHSGDDTEFNFFINFFLWRSCLDT